MTVIASHAHRAYVICIWNSAQMPELRGGDYDGRERRSSTVGHFVHPDRWIGDSSRASGISSEGVVHVGVCNAICDGRSAPVAYDNDTLVGRLLVLQCLAS
jgi:hypothetical protein